MSKTPDTSRLIDSLFQIPEESSKPSFGIDFADFFFCEEQDAPTTGMSQTERILATAGVPAGTVLQKNSDVIKVAMNGQERIGRASKTGSFGQTLDGLRVAVSVNWGEYPAHMTRQIIVTVGKLRVYEAQWCDTSRLAAVAMLEKILAGCDDSILADFRRFLGEVVL